jgi:hypothetical protein
MTTYTIVSPSGVVMETGISLRQAADAVLTSDGREYAVHKDGRGGFTLWTRHEVANLRWTATRFFSLETDRSKAEDKIFGKVVSAERFPGHCEAITDAAYAEMMACLWDVAGE